jgi:endonuclease YncB( thermonuclease family)
MSDDGWRTGGADSNRSPFVARRAVSWFAAVAIFAALGFALVEGRVFAGKPQRRITPPPQMAPPPAPPQPHFVPQPHPIPQPRVVPQPRNTPSPIRAGSTKNIPGQQRHLPQHNGPVGNNIAGTIGTSVVPTAQSHLQNSAFVGRHHIHPHLWHRGWGWWPWLPGYVGGTVTNVATGDTITVLDNAGRPRVMRLFGTAAPLLTQSFGAQSQQHLAGLIQGKVVQIRTMGNDVASGIPVAMVFYGGNYMNREQIAQGLAWNFVDDGYSEDLAGAEAEASSEQRGIWSLDYAEPPWLASVE